jgi:hypothetical protein
MVGKSRFVYSLSPYFRPCPVLFAVAVPGKKIAVSPFGCRHRYWKVAS